MDIVSHAGSIRSGVVIAKYGELWSFADDDLLHEGEEVVGVGERLIAEQMRGMRATRVEVSQRDDPPVGVHSRKGCQQHLHCCLGLAVGTGGKLLIDFSAIILVPIHSSCGGEDEIAAFSILLHQPEEVHRSDNIVLIIDHWLLE